ncbi:biotin--[acetyl-CoA-carboxylase] ligase [Neisseria sp. Ec49-e6-T10]|uniref:biotin--[acetyl-CoA-carboxylase] ligase n=1 Tax=Neisseria sp. Ec49-e6-T10 TaxID=3140744 RepID=UPI003EBCD0A7
MMTTKEQLIQILSAAKGWISGEDISETLGVSRAAIAKHITTLRKEGYLIDSATRRGYLLKLVPDEIDLEHIKKGINTKIIGQGQWFLLDESLSTNQQAILYAAQGAPEGSIIITKKQICGRGRKGKEWFSSPRSAYFSIILRPNLSSEKIPLLLTMATLAVQKTLSEFEQLKAMIKWPNDVFIHGKKISGSLVETGFIADELEWAVIGIGCNLNTVYAEFPENLQNMITSTLEETGTYFPRNLFYKNIIKWLDYYYQMILNHQEKCFLEAMDEIFDEKDR